MSDPDYVTRVGETFPSPRTSRLEAGPYAASSPARAYEVGAYVLLTREELQFLLRQQERTETWTPEEIADLKRLGVVEFAARRGAREGIL